MPINTDGLDFSRPIAEQDVTGAAVPGPSAPGLQPDRIKRMAEAFKQSTGKPAPKTETPAPAAAPAPAKPTEAAPPPAQVAPKGEAPAAPAAAPKTEEHAEEPMVLDPSVILSPRSREQFKRLEQARDSFKGQVETLKTQNTELLGRLKPMEEELTQLKAAVPPDIEAVRQAAADVEKYKKENADLLQRIETLNLEHSPRFQNWWKTETESHLKIAERNVPAEKREQIRKLLMEPDTSERNAAIDAIIEPLSNTSKRLISSAMEGLEKAKIQREEALSQGSARYKQLVEFESAKADEQAKAQNQKREQIIASALAKARNLDAFKPIEGDAEHNNEIPIREDFIKAVFTGQLDEETALSIPGLAFEAIHYKTKVVPQLKAELDKANALLKQLQASSPAPQTGRTTTAKVEAKPGSKFLTKFKEAMSGA